MNDIMPSHDIRCSEGLGYATPILMTDMQHLPLDSRCIIKQKAYFV